MLTSGRPALLGMWFKGKTKTAIPSIAQPDEFLAEVLVWYRKNQPEWRTVGVTDTDPAKYHFRKPADADWGMLAHGGSAGMYSFVIALSWCIGHMPFHHTTPFGNLVDDLTSTFWADTRGPLAQTPGFVQFAERPAKLVKTIRSLSKPTPATATSSTVATPVATSSRGRTIKK